MAPQREQPITRLNDPNPKPNPQAAPPPASDNDRRIYSLARTSFTEKSWPLMTSQQRAMQSKIKQKNPQQLHEQNLLLTAPSHN